MTELSDELLVAYAGGKLQNEQARAIDRVLEQDEVAAARLQALREANGRLESAFEAILAGELSDIRQQLPVAPPPMASPRAQEGASLVKIGLGTAGVGLILAAIVSGWPISLPDLTGMGQRADEPAQQAKASMPTWQDRALAAQSLLSRASVEIGLDSQGNRDLVAFQLGEAMGPNFKVPTLDKQGYKFVRGELLRYRESPLARVLYLTAAKPPLALYAMPSATSDSKPSLARDGSIGSVAWKNGGISYLLAGEEDDATLLKLVEAIVQESPAEAAKSGAAPLVSQGQTGSGADPVVTGSTPASPSAPQEQRK